MTRSVASMTFCQEQPIVPCVLDQPAARLHPPLLQSGQRPSRASNAERARGGNSSRPTRSFPYRPPGSFCFALTAEMVHSSVDDIEGVLGSATESRLGPAGWFGASDRPEDLVFQSVQRGLPIRDNNMLSRFLKPAGRALGMPWVNWRSLRTSHATWIKIAGADVKGAQAQSGTPGRARPSISTNSSFPNRRSESWNA